MVNVLVVDDDEQLQKLLSEILSGEGFQVKCAGNGKQAIDLSNKEFFNVALIDIHLPDMEGTELLGKLRKTEPEIIKIIITGNATLENSIDAANKGVDGYIVKPFDPAKLLKAIKQRLDKQEKLVEFDEKKVAEYIESRCDWMSTVKNPKRK
jgi:DNA-binding NtrC family response regulator